MSRKIIISIFFCLYQWSYPLLAQDVVSVPCDGDMVGTIFCPDDIIQEYNITTPEGIIVGTLQLTLRESGLLYEFSMLDGWSILSYALYPRATSALSTGLPNFLFSIIQNVYPPEESISIVAPFTQFRTIGELVDSFLSNDECIETDIYFNLFLHIISDDQQVTTSAWADGTIVPIDGCDDSEVTESVFTLACCCAAPIPTLSEWGIIILALLLLTFGAVALYHKRNATPADLIH